jgi:hypothetical protein
MKKIALCLAMFVLIIGYGSQVDAQADSSEKFVGTWNVTTTSDRWTITFNSNGTYVISGRKGKFFVNGSKLICEYFPIPSSDVEKRDSWGDIWSVLIGEYYFSSDGKILALSVGETSFWLDRKIDKK